MTTAVEISGAGNVPMLPPNPGDIPTASRRGNGRIVTAWLIVACLFLVLVVVGVLFVSHDLDNSVGKAVADVSSQGAAANALLADHTARAHHIPDGALTLALLDQQRFDVKWVAGDASVPISGAKTYVSISMDGHHVLTAANIIGCSYGLTVSTANDPIVRQDGLPGVGTYWVVPVPSQSASICSANSAPRSG